MVYVRAWTAIKALMLAELGEAKVDNMCPFCSDELTKAHCGNNWNRDIAFRRVCRNVWAKNLPTIHATLPAMSLIQLGTSRETANANILKLKRFDCQT